jgi:hypothetical protein
MRVRSPLKLLKPMLALWAGVSLAVAAQAQAQTPAPTAPAYPSKPVHITVANTPGSSPDVLARYLLAAPVGAMEAAGGGRQPRRARRASWRPTGSPRPSPTAIRCWWAPTGRSPSFPTSRPACPTTRGATWCRWCRWGRSTSCWSPTRRRAFAHGGRLRARRQGAAGAHQLRLGRQRQPAAAEHGAAQAEDGHLRHPHSRTAAARWACRT